MDRRTPAAWIAVLLMTLVLGACSEISISEEEGALYISLTDDPGDFVSYTVEVSQLTLTRRDGAVVETLEEPVTVDFSQYVELSELLTAASVPSGTYTHATLLLDYRNADIRVEDDSGNTPRVTSIRDAAGEPVETLTVSVRLEDRDQLVISPGTPAHLALDFDLSASNTVSEDYQTITVEPFLVAELEPTAPKPQRLRGALEVVQPAANRFTLLLRPFHRPMGSGLGRFGRVPVEVTDETRYEIDGTPYTGGDGLTVLDEQPRLTTPVVVLGQLRFDPLRYQADEVLAGDSVPGAGLDVVRGHVIARNGDTVTLKGAHLIQADGIVFNDRMTVELSDPDLVVRKEGGGCDDPTVPCSKADISVGQRLIAFGDWDDTNDTLTARRVRLLVTTARGVVAQSSDENGWMVMSLQGFDRRQVDLFDFTGTGVDATSDADPDAYQIDLGQLTSPTAGSAVKVRGFVHPFGEAPPDFDALTVVDLSDVVAHYRARWITATAAITLTDNGLEVNDEGADLAGYRQRGVFTDLANDGQATTLTPTSEGNGVFLIKQAGTVTLHTTYTSLTEDLTQRLAEGAGITAISAKGRPETDDGAILTVRRLAIRLE